MNQIKALKGQRIFSPINKKDLKSNKAKHLDRLPKLSVDCKVNSGVFLQNLRVRRASKLRSIKQEGNPLDRSIQFIRKRDSVKAK